MTDKRNVVIVIGPILSLGCCGGIFGLIWKLKKDSAPLFPVQCEERVDLVD